MDENTFLYTNTVGNTDTLSYGHADGDRYLYTDDDGKQHPVYLNGYLIIRNPHACNLIPVTLINPTA